LPTAPLTTALSSREYIVGGTFLGQITGSGTTKLVGGTLEAGYQIGCGIKSGVVEMMGGGGITPSLGSNGMPSVGANAIGQIKVNLKPGTVNIIPISKKTFEGTASRASITGLRVKIDGCVGQSFIRSYAIFTSTTDSTEDMVTYMGITKSA
jgi:hypothetical protein